MYNVTYTVKCVYKTNNAATDLRLDYVEIKERSGDEKGCEKSIKKRIRNYAYTLGAWCADVI